MTLLFFISYLIKYFIVLPRLKWLLSEQLLAQLKKIHTNLASKKYLIFLKNSVSQKVKDLIKNSKDGWELYEEHKITIEIINLNLDIADFWITIELGNTSKKLDQILSLVPESKRIILENWNKKK